ncbi:hypothetical protein BWI93_25335 [Siphonobacter sp. BAB-5385]|nr:hypothetical protein BWI93_25335 [Siphonobacter sp. BAB-5385]
MNTYVTGLLFLLLSSSCFGQDYSLPTGDYMDTTYQMSSKCSSCRIVYYYHINAKYPKSSATLRTEVNQYLLERKRSYQGSGYVTFRFMIDCEGKRVQRVRVLQTSSDYKTYQFDKVFVNDLFDFIKTLDRWQPGHYKNLFPVNYLTYLSFKIHDGKVIAVLP